MRRALVALAAAAFVLAAPARAQDKIKVGVLKLSSSAPVFVGVEKSCFRELGVEPQLVFFHGSWPPISTRR